MSTDLIRHLADLRDRSDIEDRETLASGLQQAMNALATEREKLANERDAAQHRSGLLSNMLRYIAFVTTGNEHGDPQLGADRLVTERDEARDALAAEREAHAQTREERDAWERKFFAEQQDAAIHAKTVNELDDEVAALRAELETDRPFRVDVHEQVRQLEAALAAERAAHAQTEATWQARLTLDKRIVGDGGYLDVIAGLERKLAAEREAHDRTMKALQYAYDFAEDGRAHRMAHGTVVAGDDDAMNEAMAQRDEACAILRVLQWVSTVAYVNAHGPVRHCPACHAPETSGHDSDCRLQGLLSRSFSDVRRDSADSGTNPKCG